MCVRRFLVDVGVLNGVLYVVGGQNGAQVWRSVEAYRPNTGVWSTIPYMHFCRYSAGMTTRFIIFKN